MTSMRNTTARTAIQNLLASSSIALSHAEIQSMAPELCDRVTVYRVLKRLLTESLIHKVVNLDGVVKYAGCHGCAQKREHSHNHIHFSCEKCESVTCLDDVEPIFKLPKRYKVTQLNFTVSGICPNCS